MYLSSRPRATAILLLCSWLGSFSWLHAQESPYIYGIHDHDTNIQEYLDHISAGGATGWVTATVAIGSDPSNTSGDDFSWISNQGHTVIVRLNNGYCGSGTIPTPDKYDAFAERAANYVAATQGAGIFIIGNETNLAGEWPPVNGHASYVSPQDYANVFRKTYDAIKAVRPDTKIISQALAPFAGPYSAGSTCGFSHDPNPLNWVQYMNQMLTSIKNSGGIDGIALHINSRGYTYGDIHSTQKVIAGGQELYFSFYVYKDWVDFGIPSDLYHLPLYATEANGIFYWSGGHPERPDSHYEPGWMQEIYAEIDRYNRVAAASEKPIFRAVNMYRWCAWCDGWNIDGSPYKGQILTDLDQAVAAQYRWPDGGSTPPPPQPSGVNLALESINWLASSIYSSDFGGAKAYDGVLSPSSKWTSDGASAESWLALDLGASFDVTGFIVRHSGAAGEETHYNTGAYRLESGGSLTGPWTTLATVTNPGQDNTSTTNLAGPDSMRYVRLYITDAGIDNYARIPEFEVYGTAAAPPPPPPPPTDPPGDNVALGAVNWSASSIYSSDFGGEKAYDDLVSPGSKWTSNGSSAESWLALDLGGDFDVTGFVVEHSGAAGEETFYNTKAYRLESGSSLTGPWLTLETVSNDSQENRTTTVLATLEKARFVRLYITDAGIDQYARIPELQVYGTPSNNPPPASGNLISNGGFDTGSSEWSVWTERGNLGTTVDNGQLHLESSDHNGGIYQRFETGGAGSTITVRGFWESHPTASNNQWAEVLIIDGPRLPVNGQDVNEGDADVWLLYKNDTWATPGGWSGEMDETAPVLNAGSFVASGAVATIILKSGNLGGTVTGTRFDDIVVERDDGTPPPNGAPTAVATASPSSGEAPLAVNFDATGSSDPDGDGLSYSWSFGDGTSGSGAMPTHVYPSAGTFTATLTVEDGKGGSATDSVTITVTATGPNNSQWVVLEQRSCSGTCDFAQIKADLNANGKDLGFVKIGFHVSPTGNQNGLGDWERKLHDAGVPLFLKSVDSAGQIYEAVQLKAASGCIDNSRSGGSPTCVPHQLVYRRSVTGNDYRPDVPYSGSPDCANPPPADIPYEQIYNETPYDAAVAHWERHRNEFPPELEPYKHLIWIETINEINRGGTCDFDNDGIGGEVFPHNQGLVDPVFGQYTKESEWIAEFAIHTSDLAMAEGFNWAAFGWSSGEPEIGSWAGPKMREFLALAAAHPDRVGIATHEYSYTTQGLELAYPHMIGRFQELFAVVDHYGIGRPSIVITEFGWTLNDIPSIGQAMNVDLPWAAELYAPHHEIHGAAIWYLGGGWGGIDDEVQQLIAPMADYATTHYFVLVPAGASSADPQP